MRILLLSYSYPPVANARAVRWSALAEEWVRKGHEVAVVTAWIPGSAATESLNGVAVHRAGLRLIERVRAGLSARRTAGFQPHEVLEKGAARGSLLSALWRRVYWPDTSCLWFFPALARARRVLRELRPDAVVSVSPTFTGVLIGMKLLPKAPFQPRWLLDLGDPFSFSDAASPNNFRLYGGLNRRVEKSAFRRAHAVAVTTEQTRARYAALFRESRSKIQVIPPLVSLPTTDSGAQPSEAMSLVYVGTLYQAIRGPEFILFLFSRLLKRPIGARLQLHIYGDVRDCRASFEQYAELIGRSVFVHGAVPRESAIRAMQQATVLVNIGNRTSYQLPSKLVEYAALSKPILNIAATADDTSAQFLQTYPRHLNLHPRSGTSEEQLSRFESFLKDIDEQRLDPVPEDWVAPYTLARISERYLQLLQP